MEISALLVAAAMELSYSSASSGCEWDIQWESLRMTLEVTGVHNAHLEAPTVKTNAVNGRDISIPLNVLKGIELAAPTWSVRAG